MILKIVGCIVIFVILLSITQTLLLGSMLIGMNNQCANIVKNIVFSLMPLVYTYCFESPLHYNAKYNPSDKVDILISNHTTTIDFAIYVSILREFDNRDIYFVLKRDIIFIPGGGFTFCVGLDIKLNRKLEEDQENIINSVKKIKSGIIIIMPEGTRFMPEKQVLAQQYSKENNYPVFKNTLFPKMKGIYLIAKILNENNKLGKILDFSTIVEKFHLKTARMKDLLTKPLGKTFTVVRTYNIPTKYLDDYNMFKKWFLKLWQKKDNILDNIKNYDYEILKPQIKSYEYMIMIIMIILFTYLTMHSFFLPLSLIASYIICAINKFTSRNSKNNNIQNVGCKNKNIL
jgi:1-acyl-sn-glycerol-3-phosphate acyltransferase